MIIYISATVLSVLLTWFSTKLKKETTREKLFYYMIVFLAMLPLFCVMAFRYNVGTDYLKTYTQRFIWHLDGYELGEIFEPGFILLIDVIQIFTTNPYWLFIICAILFCFFTYKAIYQQSNNVAYSVLILVIGGSYFASLNLMRNFIALAIFLYAFKYIKSRNFIKYTIFSIIATTFHISIMVLYPLYFIYKIKINPKIAITSIIIVIITMPLLDKIFEYIISNFVGGYAWYYNKNDSNITLLTSTIIINFVITIIQIIYYKQNKDDTLYNMYFKIQLIILIISLCSGILPMTRRLILVPSFLQILTIPYITKSEKNRKVSLMINLIIISLLCFYTIRQITVQEIHCVLPYQSIFDIK